MKRIITGALVALIALTVVAQPKFSEPHGLYDVTSLTVGITPMDATAEVRYTTDGSFPDKHSTQYSGPVKVDKTTNFILRTFNPEGRADEMTRADFVKQGYLESVVNVSSVLTPGLNAAWYEYGGDPYFFRLILEFENTKCSFFQHP